MPLHQDIRVAIRRLLSRPGATLISLLTLAFGVLSQAVACWLPTRAAMRVRPAVALRMK